MKRTVVVVLLLAIGISVFAQSGVIKELTGTVELKSAGAADYVAAASGVEVKQDTIVSTGFKSTALLVVGSTVIAVRPLTRLTLTEIRASQGTETLNVNLQAGRVRVDVNPPAGTKTSMAVTSPSATASVRGTIFDFDTRGLYVHSGTVRFKGNWGYSLDVGPDSFSGIGWYGDASAPQNNKETGFWPKKPVGSDSAAGNTGGTGTESTEPEPEPPPQPPSNGYTGGGGGTTSTPGGTIDITINY